MEDFNCENLARVTQFINKTNQFNLTTRRYTEAQVGQIAEDPDCWVRAFRLSDRMGSYGLIAVLICRPASQPATWEIDTWLVSCRVLGREMDKFMLDRLLEAVSDRGISNIVGAYLPTAKNGLVKDLYQRFGFDRVTELGVCDTQYRLTVVASQLTHASHIRNAFGSSVADAAAADSARSSGTDCVIFADTCVSVT